MSRTGVARELSLTASRLSMLQRWSPLHQPRALLSTSQLPQQYQHQHAHPPKPSISSYGIGAVAAGAAVMALAMQPDNNGSSSRLAACHASSRQEVSAQQQQQQPPQQSGIPLEFLAGLREIVGEENVTDDADECAHHGKPWSSYHKIPSVPDVVVQPGSTEDVSRILRLCWYVESY